VIVSDTFQRRGIGSRLVRLLIDFGREEKLDRITATLLQENRPMRKIFEKEGFVFKGTDDRDALDAELDLRALVA
jgi:acetyltransferase